MSQNDNPGGDSNIPKTADSSEFVDNSKLADSSKFVDNSKLAYSSKFVDSPRVAASPRLADPPKTAAGHKGALVGGIGVVGLGLLKAKGLWLILLKGLGGFKFLYVFKSMFSMFLMIGLYTMTFGWFYAFVVVGLILIHEMGHYVFMKAMHLDPKLPIFVPFMGAYVQMTKMPADQTTHAWVALAGPLVGGVTAVGMFALGVVWDKPALMAAGNTGIFLNMFQLVPCKPFDGGFVVNAISKWFLIPGTGMAFAMGIMLQSPLLLIFACLAAFMTYRAFTRPVESGGLIMGQKPSTLPEKILIGAAYFGLLCALGFVYWLSHNQLISLVPPKF
jgi:Zn-dependent protease